MKKNKVLIVGLTAGVGGVETFICNIAKTIDKSKFDIEFLMHEDLNGKYKEELSNFKIHKIRGIKSNPFLFLKEIFKFYKIHKFDIIHLNECDASYFVYVLPILFNKNIKLIVHSHNGDSNRKFFHTIFKYFQNKRCDAKWACSDVAAEWMFGKTSDKVLTIHNGIDLNIFNYNKEIRNQIRNDLNIQNNFVIGSIARFDEQKNHKKIIGIFNEYLRINPNSILLLVGSGEKQSEIKKMVEENNMNDKVLFLGLRKDIPNILNGMDLFLLPSLYEGLPFVCVESQASSLPMLVSNTVSSEVKITDLIYIYELNDSDLNWAKKIEEIRKYNINRNNSKYIDDIRKSGYDISEVGKTITEEYEKILGCDGGL